MTQQVKLQASSGKSLTIYTTFRYVKKTSKMIYRIQILVALLVVLACMAKAFQMPASRIGMSPLSMALSDYKNELAATAAAIASPGKGILAVDESTKTIGKRLESIGVTNSEEARQAYRGLLFTCPNLGKYISGAILYEVQLRGLRLSS